MKCTANVNINIEKVTSELLNSNTLKQKKNDTKLDRPFF